MTHPLIVIEGSDGSGKQTQADLALATLQANGRIVAYFDFPRYETSLAGRMVKDSLTGKFGDFVGLHPKQASLPYTLDRAGARDDLVVALKRGVVICNRYVPSNSAHQGAKFAEIAEQDEFIAWLEMLEHDELKLPRPTTTFYLYVPFEISHTLMEGRARDQHESNEPYLRKVIDVYLRIARERPDWKVVTCVQDGKLRSREDIHQEVMSQIRLLLS